MVGESFLIDGIWTTGKCICGQKIEDKTKLKVKENCSSPMQPFLKIDSPQQKRGGYSS